MKRFIQHEELARDSRFVRQDNAQSTVLATLPDDVDTVVNAFEQFSPMIEASVRGTAAEPLFDEYGPGFALTILNEPLDPTAGELLVLDEPLHCGSSLRHHPFRDRGLAPARGAGSRHLSAGAFR